MRCRPCISQSKPCKADPLPCFGFQIFHKTVISTKKLSSKTALQKVIQKWAFGLILNNIDQNSEEIHPKKFQMRLK